MRVMMTVKVRVLVKVSVCAGDKEANVRESVEKAKLAVSLDVKDGLSWSQ